MLSFAAAAVLALQGEEHLTAAVVGMAITYALQVVFNCYIRLLKDSIFYNIIKLWFVCCQLEWQDPFDNIYSKLTKGTFSLYSVNFMFELFSPVSLPIKCYFIMLLNVIPLNPLRKKSQFLKLNNSSVYKHLH